MKTDTLPASACDLRAHFVRSSVTRAVIVKHIGDAGRGIESWLTVYSLRQQVYGF
jgi:hypothetical protein